MRKQIAAANWKMNLTLSQASDLLDEVLSKPRTLGKDQWVVFGVPFPYLPMAVEKIRGRANTAIAAQNCYTKKSGAYTGEVSVEMLKSVGVTHVIVGHSERREYFGESNAMLAEKLNLALESGLTPIFCCGEPLSIREAETQNAFVEKQLKESLYHLSPEQLLKIVIAYEPIWAIGTGKTASSAQAQEIQAYLRSALASQYGNEIANQVSILYGGSVKANNAVELFGCADVDGGLVGGASLNGVEFGAIIDGLKK